MAKINKTATIIIRVTVSIALISFLIYRNLDNFMVIGQQARELDLYYLGIAVFLYFLGIAIMVFRWGILLQAQGIHIYRPFLLQSIMIGFLYNNILPTTVGGDAYRVYDLHKNKNVAATKTTSTVVLERFIGIVTGLVYLLASFAFGMYHMLDFNMLVSMLVFLGAMFLVVAILINPYFFKVDLLFKKFRLLRKVRPKLSSFREIMLSYRSKKSHFFISCLYSFIMQFFFILAYWSVSTSMGLGIRLSAFVFMVQVVSIVSNIPITVGGIGIRENALAFLLVTFGTTQGEAALFSFIILFIILFNAMLGGLVYLAKNIFYRSKGVI